MEHMISIIIPTRNAERGLENCLDALRPARQSGLIGEVIVVDASSIDTSVVLAERHECVTLSSAPGRATQMHFGAQHARSSWLMFLHADVILEAGWEREVHDFTQQHGVDAQIVAVFRFALRHDSWKARLLEHIVSLRCRLLALPYGDQGLLIPSGFYNSLDGFAILPLMEDVELMRRIGRKRIKLLRSRARSDAVRYQKDGFFARMTRNAILTSLFLLGVSARQLASFYETRRNL